LSLVPLAEKGDELYIVSEFNSDYAYLPKSVDSKARQELRIARQVSSTAKILHIQSHFEEFQQTKQEKEKISIDKN